MMTVSSVLKTLSVATTGSVAIALSLGEAVQAFSLNGSFSLTGTAIFGKPNEASPLEDTLSFQSNRIEDGASGSFASLVGLTSPTLLIETLNLTRIGDSFNPIPEVTTSFYQFTPSSNPFINFGSHDLFGTGETESLTFNLNPGIAQRNYFSSNSFNTVNLTEVTGIFLYGNNAIGRGSLTALRSREQNRYTITLRAEPIPEPFTILGSLSALGVGTLLKKQHEKRHKA